MLVHRPFAAQLLHFFGLISTTVPVCTFLVGDSKCGEIFQRWLVSVTTVTVLRLNFITVPGRRSPLGELKLTCAPGWSAYDVFAGRPTVRVHRVAAHPGQVLLF